MDYAQNYADFLKKHLDLKKPLKIVCDPSNGTAGLVLKKFTNTRNLELILINETPDPEFSAHGPNPIINNAMAQLSAKVVEVKADFGVIFDSDADRAFFVDEKGHELDSYMTSLLLFKKNKPPYVADELVYKSLEHIKALDMSTLFPSKIGSANVKVALKEHSASVGGELSGHYYYKEFFGTDSGILTMIFVANTVSHLDTHLSVFRDSLPKEELVTVEVKLGDKKWADIEPKIKDYFTSQNIAMEFRDGITMDTNSLWINIRSSNTEPIFRLIGGGKKEEVTAMIEKIRAAVGV